MGRDVHPPAVVPSTTPPAPGASRSRSGLIVGIAALAAVALIATVAIISRSGPSGGPVAVGTDATATTTGAGAPTTSGSPPSAIDTTVANWINFTGADFPSGWTGAPNQDNSNTSQDAQLTSCAGAPDPLTSVETDVSSADFSDNGNDVTSDVTIMKTAPLALQDLAAMTSPKALGCFRTLFPGFAKASAPAGTQISIVSVNKLPVANYGAGSFGYRVLMNVTSSGVNAVATVDEIGILKGRLEISGIFTGIGTAFPAGLESSLMTTLTGRATTAPAI